MQKTLKKFWPISSLALLILLGWPEGAFRKATSTEPVTRQVLASGDPISSPNYTLSLIRYTIVPGYQLPPHTHPGMQIAMVESGKLKYKVVKGESQVFRRNSQSSQLLKTGEETLLEPGDSIVEPETTIHYGVNEGKIPVVLLGTALLRSDQPPTQIIKGD